MNRIRFLIAAVAAGGALLSGGCLSTPKTVEAPAVARFVVEAGDGQPGVVLTLPVSGVSVRVQPKPVISEFDVASVAEAQVELGRCLAFRFTPGAARDLYRLSASHLGSRLVLVINGQPVGARVLDRAIDGGVLFIFAELPDDALPALVQDLNRTTAALQAQAAKAK